VDRLADHQMVLSAAGYEVLHVIGGYEEDGKQHGLLIGWKQDLLHLVDQKVIRFDEQEFKSRVGLSRATRNVGLIAGLAFKHHPGGLVIGTAHLFWHSRYSYERTRQTAFLAKALSEFEIQGRDTTRWPVFLAGDLNEQPGGPSYRLLSGAALPEKEQLILKESTLIHKSADHLLSKKTDETYVTFEGDEDRVFKDVRPSRVEDGLFDIHELKELFGSHRWLSLYGNWADKMTGEEDNWFKDRPEFKDQGEKGHVVPCLDELGSGQYEPMWSKRSFNVLALPLFYLLCRLLPHFLLALYF
jgi:RNA exonuclease NGL2